MDNLRGVWLANVDSNVFDSKQNIAEAMQVLADAGFNYVFPVVWNQGFTLFPSSVMKNEFLDEQFEIDSRYTGRDPLAEVIEEASKKDLEVIPWLEFGFSSSYNANGGHILEAKPEWAAKDQSGNLLKKNGFEWMNALDVNVQGFMLQLILEVVTKYPVAGIQGDDRLPSLPSEGGYDSKTRKLHKDKFGTEPPLNTKDATWLKFRADILTGFLNNLKIEVKAVRPDLLISMAPSPYPFGYKEYLQDYPTWLEKNLVDLLHPQFYRKDDLIAYKGLVDDAVDRLFDKNHPEHLFNTSPGVLTKSGIYNIDPTDLWECIKYNRNNGIRGEVQFFYEGLRHNNDACIKLLQQKNYSKFIILKREFIGPDVEEVQKALVAKGYYTDRADGDFGPLTEKAVKKFQMDEGVSPDGIVGPKTYAKLFA
jgi:uncharacterized lipoprotein YddW (UPF0748 family)